MRLCKQATKDIGGSVASLCGHGHKLFGYHGSTRLTISKTLMIPKNHQVITPLDDDQPQLLYVLFLVADTMAIRVGYMYLIDMKKMNAP